jgi:hypothetical protein
VASGPATFVVRVLCATRWALRHAEE